MAHPFPSNARANMSTPAAPTATAPSSLNRRPRGVRRRREEPAIEIEELDSDVMRQNAYNYFQDHGRRIGFADTGASASDGASAGSSTRKRQRTLAEQLEELCLQPNSPDGTASPRPRAISAAAACRQAWSRLLSSRLAAQQQRAATAAATSAPSRPAPDVDMDSSMSEPSSPAEDADLEDAAEDDDDERQDGSGIKIFGGVPDVKGMFFATGGRQRPMERMFRHYVTMAAERSSRGEASTPRGDELVLFQPGPTSLDFPYSLFTPEQIEDLRARHNRKKKRQATQERASRQLFSSPFSSEGSPPSTGWRFQELDSSDEADVSSSAEDSDMDISTDESSRRPQPAGALSHGEWFVEDEDEDEVADDDIDSDL